MKKIFLPIVAIALGFSPAIAQDFSFQHDTTFVSTPGNEDDPDEFVGIYNYVINKTTSPLTYKWRFLNPGSRPTGWSYNGFCDNIVCHPSSSPWTAGAEMTSAPVAAGDSSLFKLQLGIPKSIAENTTAIFAFEVTTPSQKDTTFYIVEKKPLSINIIPMDDVRVGVYPNPAHNEFTLFTNKELNAHSYSIINLVGQRVQNATLTNTEINTVDISQLSNGLYFVQVLNDKGTVITSRKFNKQ